MTSSWPLRPTSSMRATVLLCDAAQADPGGKVHILGAGWSATSAPTPPMAVVVLLSVPWDRTNEELTVRLTLVDADGRPVQVAGPEGPTGLRIEQRLEVGRPPGMPHGTAIEAPLVVGIGPGLPLAPGARYVWQLDVNGEVREEWSAGFFVRDGVSG